MALGEILSKGINYAILLLLVYYVFIDEAHREKHHNKSVSQQVELTKPGKLLNSTYQLEEHGFSKHYVKEVNAENLYSPIFGLQKLNHTRFKKFEHYFFYYDNKIVQIAAANVYIGGNIFLIVYDYEKKELVYENVDLMPFLDNAQFPDLADNVFACLGNYSSEKSGLRVKVDKKLEGNICRTQVEFNAEGKAQGSVVFKRNVHHEDMFTISPITEDNRYWYYNLKAYNLSCEGTLNGETLEGCVGASDYGRGLFPYKTNWIWGTASGKSGKHNFSLELGGGIPHESSNTFEDAFKVGTKVFKLSPLAYTYDKLNYMNGFTMKTHENYAHDMNNAADIVFRSSFVHTKKDNLIIIKSNMDYIYGTYSGWVTDDKGNKFEFEDIHGFVEIAKFRW